MSRSNLTPLKLWQLWGFTPPCELSSTELRSLKKYVRKRCFRWWHYGLIVLAAYAGSMLLVGLLQLLRLCEPYVPHETLTSDWQKTVVLLVTLLIALACYLLAIYYSGYSVYRLILHQKLQMIFTLDSPVVCCKGCGYCLIHIPFQDAKDYHLIRCPECGKVKSPMREGMTPSLFRNVWEYVEAQTHQTK